MKTEKKPYHHGDLESALVKAALETIRDEGVDALTLRGVGTRLGVSRTALYRHFADKAELLARVSLEGFRGLRTALLSASGAAAVAGEERLRHLGETYVAFALEHPAYYRTMFGRAIEDWNKYPELLAEAEGAFHVLLKAVIEGQRAGQIKPGDPQLLAEVIWAMVHGVAMLTIDGQLHGKSSGQSPKTLGSFASECLLAGILVALPERQTS